MTAGAALCVVVPVPRFLGKGRRKRRQGDEVLAARLGGKRNMGKTFNHVGMTVTDIAKTAAFYQHFGFEPVY